jgi:DNA-binding MarR family transcriptional regulator
MDTGERQDKVWAGVEEELTVKAAPSLERSARTQAQVRAMISLLVAADELQRDADALLKSADLSGSQYNVLRILRGGEPDGLRCGDVIARLIKRDPDVTRLMDRLERRGFIARGRDARDRRVVRTRITPAGLELLARLDEPVDALHERQFGHMSESRLGELTALVQELLARRP